MADNEAEDDVDPITTAALTALGRGVDPTSKEAAVVGGKLALNLFGPVTEELGLILRDRVHNRHVVNVVKQAERKERTTGQSDGAIPLRAAKAVLEAAEVAEDEFVVEYLSGVLASARTPGGRDDSAVTWTALVGRLSAAQLRLHWALCTVFRQVAAAEDPDTMYLVLRKQVALPVVLIAHFMGDQWDRIKTLDALYGLQAESLVGDMLTHGDREFVSKTSLRTMPDDFPSDWWLIRLTQRSLGLYLNAFGYGGEWMSAVLDPAHDFALPDEGTLHPEVLRGYFVDDLPPFTGG